MQSVDGGHLQWIRPNVFPITHKAKGEEGQTYLQCVQMAHKCKVMHYATL